MLEALREEKSVAQVASENQIDPNQIHKWKKQALENFSQLFEEKRQGLRAKEAEHERQLDELYAEIGRLSAQFPVVMAQTCAAGRCRGKNLACMSRAERLAMLEKENPELSMKVQAELLGISYSSLFYKPMQPSERELAITRRIDEMHTAFTRPFFNSKES